ncbi:MAG: serine hydrolase domain-containing protein [Halieaceae bacterium]|nr:serine hydrolase domain-containing protein [Halieaceae bacterium]
MFALLMVAGCAPDPGARVDALFADYRGADTPGAAVLVIRDGEKLLERSYGSANLETGSPVEAVTNFRLASITKQFTATAIMLLVEEGSLSLDTQLSSVFPEFSAYAEGITIRHLLQHQSGLPDYEPLVPEGATEQVHDADVLEMMARAESAYFEAGSEYRYSNSGYAVLAMVVEKLTGREFPDFLHDHIFAPLEMRNTVAFVAGRNEVPRRALGYTVDDSGVRETDQSLYSAVLGDGGVYSSLDDLYRWDQALYTDAILPREVREQMLTPSLEDYGLGWRIDRYRGHLRYHHSGSTSGFRNFMQQFPEQRLTVIVLSNRAKPDVKPLAERVGDLFL